MLLSFAVVLTFSLVLDRIVLQADNWLLFIMLCLISTVVSFFVSLFVIMDSAERNRLYAFIRGFA